MSNLAPDDIAQDVLGTCSSIQYTIETRTRDVGGFEVRRVLPDQNHQMIGPWIFFDEMGPNEFKTGQGLDVRPHPHINLATVTYLFEGKILHRDSLGSEQVIEPGEINLMVAGSGIVHSERTPHDIRHAPHILHGLQLWLALPDEFEETTPCFLHYAAHEIPSFTRGSGAFVKILIGEAYGQSSPVKVYSPTLYLDVQLEEGAEITLPEGHVERGLYLMTGDLYAKDTVLKPKTMTIFSDEAGLKVRAAQPSHFVIVGGDPLGRRHISWNFVSSQSQRIEKAKNDWKNNKFPGVPGDSEPIPLPEDRPK